MVLVGMQWMCDFEFVYFWKLYRIEKRMKNKRFTIYIFDEIRRYRKFIKLNYL